MGECERQAGRGDQVAHRLAQAVDERAWAGGGQEVALGLA
jgi:hypothetical protein